MSVTLSELSKQWLALSQPYRPSAFWFWNDGLNPEDLRNTVAEMARVGIREFLIHPVHGMEIEYLSAEYFDRLRLALGLADEFGLKVWIYDEFGWPSGNAGGLLLRDHPEHKGWYLAFTKDEHGNVTARPTQSDMILDNTMGAPWAKSEAGYVDTLSEDAMRCFIELTHERILRECGELFHRVVVGFFTDEPTAMVPEWKVGHPGPWTAIGMPWTPALPSLFKERFGYDIESRYTELAGENPGQTKRDYWALVKDMHAGAYHGQIGKWCRDHGVKYTGHLGEDLPIMHVRFAGSVYQCLRHMDEPGIDYLSSWTEPDDRFIEMTLIPSAARHAGKNRVYCEAYGISALDIRLGDIMKRYQMFGLYGVNDIALMGFHHSISGVRKQTYWPPIFTTTAWWEFYPEFRDACARSVSLSSLGTPQSRYAILYPQNQLEQVNLFNDFDTPHDPASEAMAALARAIYSAGETFEFVFPEILHEGRVEGGRIVFPHAQYDAILAPSDLSFFDESMRELDRLASEGGRLYRGQISNVADSISSKIPSWTDKVDIESDGGYRVYRFAYPDGELLAIRNVTGEPIKLRLSPSAPCSQWNPLSGEIAACSDKMSVSVEPHGTEYIAFCESAMVNSTARGSVHLRPLDAQWMASGESLNTARLAQVEFLHDELGWIPAIDSSISSTGHKPSGIPQVFEGYTRIRMRAKFECAGIPDKLGIVFEADHLEALWLNGHAIDLTKSEPLQVWDTSCRWVDIRERASDGENRVEGVLSYEEFETRVSSQAFFVNHPMPSCDVCLSGDFRLTGSALVTGHGSAHVLPADFSADGWGEYGGILDVECSVALDALIAGQICGLMVEPVSDDCIELLVDGVSCGRRISAPYTFDLFDLEPGQHSIKLRVSGTTANILGTPSPWGISAVSWMIS